MGSRTSRPSTNKKPKKQMLDPEEVEGLIKTKLHQIIQHWLRELSIVIYPNELKTLIINSYTYYNGFAVDYPPKSYHLYNIIVIGNSNVGKTSLMVRYDRDIFTNYGNGLGPEFATKIIDINDQKVKLRIWDTCGQERFRTLTSAYYRNAHGALLCYDVTDRASVEGIKQWSQECDKHGIKLICRRVVGCKYDLIKDAEMRQFDKDDVMNDLREVGGIDSSKDVIETSALNKYNVDQVFEEIAKDIFDYVDYRKTHPFFG